MQSENHLLIQLSDLKNRLEAFPLNGRAPVYTVRRLGPGFNSILLDILAPTGPLELTLNELFKDKQDCLRRLTPTRIQHLEPALFDLHAALMRINHMIEVNNLNPSAFMSLKPTILHASESLTAELEGCFSCVKQKEIFQDPTLNASPTRPKISKQRRLKSQPSPSEEIVVEDKIKTPPPEKNRFFWSRAGIRVLITIFGGTIAYVAKEMFPLIKPESGPTTEKVVAAGNSGTATERPHMTSQTASPIVNQNASPSMNQTVIVVPYPLTGDAPKSFGGLASENPKAISDAGMEMNAVVLKDITFDQYLSTSYRLANNPSAFEEFKSKLIGKNVTWRGKLFAPMSASGKGSITLLSTGESAGFIKAEIDDTHQISTWLVEKGQLLEITGQITEASLNTVHLKAEKIKAANY